MWYLCIYPYINLIAVILFVLSEGIIKLGNGTPEGVTMFAGITALYLLALCISFMAKNATMKRAAIIKTVHIGYYIAAFIAGVAMVLTVMGIPVALAIVIGDILTIIPSGIYMARTKCPLWQKICGFIFVADVIVAWVSWSNEKSNVNM